MRARKASDSAGPRMRSSEVLLISATLSVLLSSSSGSRERSTWAGFSSSVLEGRRTTPRQDHSYGLIGREGFYVKYVVYLIYCPAVKCQGVV